MKKGITITVLVLTLILIIVLAYAIVLFIHYPEYASSKKDVDGTGKAITNEVTVMSYNVRCFVPFGDFFGKSWFSRAESVLSVIEQEDPDIIGFQEITPIHERYLKKHLKGYAFIVSYRDKQLLSEGVMIAYRTEMFDEESSGMFWLSETPAKMSKGWDAQMYRVAAYVNLVRKTDGKRVAFYDTHLDHIGEQARINGMRLMSDRIKADAPDCAFVVGDMNDYDDSAMYQNALTSGLADAMVVAQSVSAPHGCTYQGYGTELDSRRIDYCFLSSDITVTEYHVNETGADTGVYPSDHFPIIVKTVL